MAKWYDSTVIRIEDASATTKRFWLEIDEAGNFDFRAGQFITLDLPIGEKRLQRWRSYSIASAPDGSNVLELCIVHLEGGLASGYFFNDVKVGTALRFKDPDGMFVLPEKIEKDLVFVCTGTGVAPFRSMLLDLYGQNKPHRNIHLIFGTRYREGILYQKDFEKLVEKMPGFSYSVALSREETLPPGGQLFDTCKGYVHQVYLEKYATVRPDVQFYLCGWTKMIDEAVENLVAKLGYDRAQVKYELYG
ncbi:MAG: FAD-dependent oxidoreductase [Saprospiraceae bacterium]|nr:MAG: FAD-dependent oxidoreductase [Saprospiraceae bacterium]